MCGRLKVLVVVVASMLAVAGMGAAGGAAAATSSDCRAVAGGPFLYVDMVIPDASIQCAAPAGRIRVYGVLTRDGVTVESGRRDCRNTSVCHLSVDISHADAPGDQRWCVRVWGSVNPNQAVPEATACDQDTF
jgi:hypothetical protein